MSDMKAFKALCAKATKRPYGLDLKGLGILGSIEAVADGAVVAQTQAVRDDSGWSKRTANARLLTVAANNVALLVERLAEQARACDCPTGCLTCDNSWALLAKIEKESGE